MQDRHLHNLQQVDGISGTYRLQNTLSLKMPMQNLTSANAALADTAHKIMYNAFLHPVEQAKGDLMSKIQDSLLV